MPVSPPPADPAKAAAVDPNSAPSPHLAVAAPLVARFSLISTKLVPGGGAAAAVLLLYALLRLAPGLAHPSIASWDEAAHQAVTRGLYDTGLPVIYSDPLVPIDNTDWMKAHVFLHKPTTPFALSALVMRLTGISPLALRLVSLGFAYLTAVCLFLLGRRSLGAWLALGMALAFLTLPFDYNLVQGFQFGDVTDCSLLGALSLTFVFLTLAVERDSLPIAALGGAAFGLAFLCKTALAITPLGVAGSLYLLGWWGLIPPVRGRPIAIFLLVAVVVAAPLNLVQAWVWPELYGFEGRYALSFFSGHPDAFTLPIDAIFNQINEWEFTYWPSALLPVAGLWLVWAALRRREAGLWILALWLWGEWIPLSIASVKAPAHTWGVAPVVLIALGLMLREALSRPWLAGAALAGLATPAILSHLGPNLPALAKARAALPALLEQTRARPGLLEGLLLISLGAGAAALLAALAGRRFPVRLLGGGALVWGLWTALVTGNQALSARQAEMRNQRVEAYTDTLGRALDGSLPKKSVLFWGLAADTPCCFEDRSLAFYAGRMVYKEPLTDLARRKGYHPYLISGRDEAFTRVAAVPGRAWLQAYDLDAPASGPTPLPPDVTLAAVAGPTLTLLGLARDTGSGDRDRYVFYVQATSQPAGNAAGGRRAQIEFQTRGGGAERVVLDGARTLLRPEQLSGATWFTLTTSGPLRASLSAMTFDGQPVPLP